MKQLDLLADLIGRAKAAGADAADAILLSGTSISVERRLGRTEKLEQPRTGSERDQSGINGRRIDHFLFSPRAARKLRAIASAKTGGTAFPR